MTTHIVETPQGGETERETRMLEVAGAGATAGALGAAGAIVLAIIGLTGSLTEAMMPIATIVLGVAILLDAGAVGARYRRLVGQTWEGARRERTARLAVGGGISAGSLGGIAGIVLGILALLGFSPMLLCSVALVVFGAALLFGSAARSRFASVSTLWHGASESTRRVVDEAVGVSAGGEVLVGVGAIVLGILALLGFQPMTLVLVGLLSVGVAVLMSGSALGARVFGTLRHAPH